MIKIFKLTLRIEVDESGEKEAKELVKKLIKFDVNVTKKGKKLLSVELEELTGGN